MSPLVNSGSASNLQTMSMKDGLKASQRYKTVSGGTTNQVKLRNVFDPANMTAPKSNISEEPVLTEAEKSFDDMDEREESDIVITGNIRRPGSQTDRGVVSRLKGALVVTPSDGKNGKGPRDTSLSIEGAANY